MPDKRKGKPPPKAPVVPKQAEPKFVLDVRRPPRNRAIGRRILILCEGEKTETGYFNDMRVSLRLEPDKIIVLKAEGTDPLSIVQDVCAERNARRQEQNWVDEDNGTGDVAWAVFDGDEHKASNPERWQQAIDLANREGIRLAISNPAFEYWYLLHFQDQSANLDRVAARRLLKKHLPDYEKSNVLYRTMLRDKTDEAIRRAKGIAKQAERNDLGKYENPCCYVFELVELILSLQRERR